MQIRVPAIVVSVRTHGEHGSIVRVLTSDFGLLCGYVRGGRSKRIRPTLVAGNIIAASFSARNETQLASLSVELITSRAPLLSEALAAAAIEWVTALAAIALPEGHPYARVYTALDGILRAVEAAPSAREWYGALVRYEAVVLTELGYGTIEADGLTTNGIRLREDLLTGRRADILPARDRLVDRLDRAMGR